MASKIDASTSGAGGIITTADNSGVLQLQSGGVTKATIDSAGFSTPSVTNAGTLALAATGANIITASTNGAERMRIDSSGNLLLTAAATVSVSSIPPASQFDTRLVFGGSGSIGNAQNSVFYWRRTYDNVDVAAVNGAGSFFSLSNSYGALSDPRYKENIEPARSYTADLCRLQVVKYSLKVEKSDKPTQLGLLSTNVKEVFPSLVSYTNETDSDGKETGKVIEGVKYSVFVPMLIKAIQEQQAMIVDLKARIETLEAV